MNKNLEYMEHIVGNAIVTLTCLHKQLTEKTYGPHILKDILFSGLRIVLATVRMKFYGK